MNTFVIFAVVLLGANVIHADRPKAEKILDEIEKVRPHYREVQDFVINTIGNARLNSSEQLAKFHSDVLLVKQTFVVAAIQKENALLFQVNNQPSSVDKNCLSFITSLSDSIMNLAGTGYSTCITETSDTLEKTISAFYKLLQQDETEYIGIGLLDIFKGENIFYNPESILYKLQQKTSSIDGYPTYLENDLRQTVYNLRSSLESLEMTYIGCMTDSEQMLKNGFNLADSYMDNTCRAVKIPVTTTSHTGIVPDNAAENAPAWFDSAAIKQFRERFGLSV